MIWPFKKRETDLPDNRPVSVAARAVAISLETEPERWSVVRYNGYDHLIHDSKIAIDMNGWIRQPNLEDEPEANAEFLQAAIEKWIDARLKAPLPEPDEDEEPEAIE